MTDEREAIAEILADQIVQSVIRDTDHPVTVTVDVPGNGRWTCLCPYGRDLPLEADSLNALIRTALAEAINANANLEAAVTA